MGKTFSCLPSRRRGSHAVTKTKEESTGPERKDDVEEICLNGAENRETAIWKRGVDKGRTVRDISYWTLEDIENKREDDASYSAAQHRNACNYPQKHSATEVPSSRGGSPDLANPNPADRGFADVTCSPVPRPGSRGSISWPSIQDEASPRRMQTMNPDSIPVSLRQAHEDLTKRLKKQRSMTRALLYTKRPHSPSPRHLHTAECHADKTKADIENSQGDRIMKETDHIQNTIPGKANDTSNKANNTHNADVTNPDKAISNELTENRVALNETEDIMAGDSLRQLEDDFFREFPVDSVELTPVPSFLKITGDGELPAILKEENLKRLEEAFFQAFPVDDIAGNYTGCDSEARENDFDNESNSTHGSRLSINDDGDKENVHIEASNVDDAKPRVDKGDDSSDDLRSPDERLMKLATLFENAFEEEREECEDLCYSMILQCIDRIAFGICVAHSVESCRNIVFEPCIRRLKDDTDVFFAIDRDGICHPILRGRYEKIAIDVDGIGHPCVHQ